MFRLGDGGHVVVRLDDDDNGTRSLFLLAFLFF